MYHIYVAVNLFVQFRSWYYQNILQPYGRYFKYMKFLLLHIVTKLQFRVFQTVFNFFTKGSINDTIGATLLVQQKFLFDAFLRQAFPTSVLHCHATASLAFIKSMESLFFKLPKLLRDLQLQHHISIERFL